MLFDLAVVFATGLALFWLTRWARLPGQLGLILCGILIGPEVVAILDAEAAEVTAELRVAALIIILVRAGLGIDRETLNRVGHTAALLGTLPAICEGTVITLIAWKIIGFSLAESGMLGFIIAAISPAIVVPQMIELREKGFGKRRDIPTLILAGASLDDVVAITVFGIFSGLAMGESGLAARLLDIPVAIGLGLVIGLAAGALIIRVSRSFGILPARVAILVMIAGILMVELEKLHLIPIAGLLGVMAMGFVILERDKQLSRELAVIFAGLWVAAEIILFVSIGAAINLTAALRPETLLLGLFVIAAGLLARSLAVWFSVAVSGDFKTGERAFCVVANIPKATVQAALGAVPLSLGVPQGDVILSIAVLSIIITAPLGSIAISWLAPRLLDGPNSE